MSTKPPLAPHKATARAGAKKQPMATRRAAGAAHKRPLKVSRNEGKVPLPRVHRAARQQAGSPDRDAAVGVRRNDRADEGADGWQADTLRGTISGVLRKRLGFNVVSNALIENGARTYRIVAASGIRSESDVCDA